MATCLRDRTADISGRREKTYQHDFYCGIDLHAQSLHVLVVDQAGDKHLHRNFNTKKPERLLIALQPFEKRDLVVGCESTFNWYWLADLCRQQKLPFLLGHALYLKAIHGGKTKSDRIDSEKLAMLLRGGNFPISSVYPKEIFNSRPSRQQHNGAPRTSCR